MADITGFGFESDVAFANHMIEELGVATVPGGSFFHDPALGSGRLRFSYPKRLETIQRGLERLQPLRRNGYFEPRVPG